MEENESLAKRFEEHRGRLHAVAYRLLGSSGEAEDAVQEGWLRLSGADTDEVENLSGWLTTVVGRISLNMLRARDTRREDPWGTHGPDADVPHEDGAGPEDHAVLTDSIGVALLVVLDTLTPAERLVFVLHDLFSVPFDSIAPIVERSTVATRQLASRARRRLRGASRDSPIESARQRKVVEAFLAASRGGDFTSLLTLLDPDVVLRIDGAAASTGAQGARGATAVANVFAGRAKAARPAYIDGKVGLVWSADGRPRVVFGFTLTGERIAAIDMRADPGHLSELSLELITTPDP
ncbi:sigma-70 family RNA polymerase sigma factor [Streptomyces iconiensis]|uniref:Sigma-70 family RNA polymerase sigma factor n=1 Tax=Streptomyces iconiensis TaxID=1384038 RepID=A0ABT6ZSJ3_9ACTN|nr:sigma-70 family RNA polymerase sigma factor [Streptomyces iconiensis]MDJ1131847.1 sigma-70 family RNA polymerase sigma factor [Streptomyces iconiensis]